MPEDCVESVHPIHPDLRLEIGSGKLEGMAELAFDGSFSVADLPWGVYRAAFARANWLHKFERIDLSNGSHTGLAVSLPKGDAGDDNAATVLDSNVPSSHVDRVGDD